MEITEYQNTYEEYKKELGGELKRAIESFVRIGYLLKVARDTDVLKDSGYTSVVDFARAEFGLDKSQVSRFISVNDKYAQNGYSDQLREEYRGYGYAKLVIMLQLPDYITEELNTNYSKSEIQAIKEELDEEQKVSDIERAIEGNNPLEKDLDGMEESESMLYKAILQLGEDDPELYIKICESKYKDLSVELPVLMAPSGDKTYSIRVKGIGRLMLMISELSDCVKLINSRTGEKNQYSWSDIELAWTYAGIMTDGTPIECWERRYERKCQVAPVQQKTEPKKEEKRKESKVAKAPEKPKAQTLHEYNNDIPEPQPIEEEPEEEEKPINTPCEEQLEGQMNVEDFPEALPEQKDYIDAEFREVETDIEDEADTEMDENDEPAAVLEPEKPINTPCDTDFDNTVRGYKAAVANRMRQLKALWESNQDIPTMLEIMDDLRWNLVKIQEMQSTEAVDEE